jgi:hypothetical protein
MDLDTQPVVNSLIDGEDASQSADLFATGLRSGPFGDNGDPVSESPAPDTQPIDWSQIDEDTIPDTPPDYFPYKMFDDSMSIEDRCLATDQANPWRGRPHGKGQPSIRKRSRSRSPLVIRSSDNNHRSRSPRRNSPSPPPRRSRTRSRSRSPVSTGTSLHSDSDVKTVKNMLNKSGRVTSAAIKAALNNDQRRATHVVDFLTNKTEKATVNAGEAMLEGCPLRCPLRRALAHFLCIVGKPLWLASTSTSSSSSSSSSSSVGGHEPATALRSGPASALRSGPASALRSGPPIWCDWFTGQLDLPDTPMVAVIRDAIALADLPGDIQKDQTLPLVRIEFHKSRVLVWTKEPVVLKAPNVSFAIHLGATA